MRLSDLTSESLISILLHPERRAQLVQAMSQEQGTHLPFRNRYADLAGDCQATSEELRTVTALLKTRKYHKTGLLDDLIFHPQMPEDVLLDLAHQQRWVTPLAHRSGPRALLEYIAQTYRESEAITTLALDYYALDSDETFAAFISEHRDDDMLRGNVLKSSKISPAKQAIALDLLGDSADRDKTTEP